MIGQIKSAYVGTPILGVFAHSINDIHNQPILTVKPKLGFHLKYHFYKDNQLIFYGVLKKAKTMMNKKFEIFNQYEEKIAIINQKLFEQKNKKYHIQVGLREYEAKYKVAYRRFSIKDSYGELCVEGNLISSILQNLIELRKYKVDIFDHQLDYFLWLVIVKGMRELE